VGVRNTAHANLTLIAVLVADGLTLGTLIGMATSVWRRGDSVLSRARLLAAFLSVRPAGDLGAAAAGPCSRP
jgi:hypothetical protein